MNLWNIWNGRGTLLGCTTDDDEAQQIIDANPGCHVVGYAMSAPKVTE